MGKEEVKTFIPGNILRCVQTLDQLKMLIGLNIRPIGGSIGLNIRPGWSKHRTYPRFTKPRGLIKGKPPKKSWTLLTMCLTDTAMGRRRRANEEVQAYEGERKI